MAGTAATLQSVMPRNVAVLTVDLVPPRMIISRSCRSRTVSTSVTSAGESSSPHGVRRPNDSFIHCL